jgi:hypothetical protein
MASLPNGMRRGGSSDQVLLFELRSLAQRLKPANEAGYFRRIRFQREMTGIQHVQLYVLEILSIRFGTGGRKHKIALAPHHERRRLKLTEIGVPLLVVLDVTTVISV